MTGEFADIRTVLDPAAGLHQTRARVRLRAGRAADRSALASTSPRVIGLSAVPRTARVRCVSKRPSCSAISTIACRGGSASASSWLGTSSISLSYGRARPDRCMRSWSCTESNVSARSVRRQRHEMLHIDVGHRRVVDGAGSSAWAGGRGCWRRRNPKCGRLPSRA